MSNKIRVRFPPSPTGFLHIGGLRTALYNWLFTQSHKGKFILRIEDTDLARTVPGALVNIMEVLAWAGLDWDEGPRLECQMSKSKCQIKEKGKYGPYLQSRRLKIYQKLAQELVKKQKAYYCFCSEARLEKMRQEQKTKKQAPMYNGYCRDLSFAEQARQLKRKIPYVIRLKVPPDGETSFIDIIRGQVRFQNRLIDDQILLKSDGWPTYHLANVTDDHLMEVTHVIRGEDWISSTPKHILLYQAFDWKLPQFAHLPLLLNPDKTKLSKRAQDVAVQDYIEKGYLKEALINFVALLGWNPTSDQEIFSLEELIKKFNLKKVNKAGAIFNQEKLDWLNGFYIRKTPLIKLTRMCIPYLEKARLISQKDSQGFLYQIKASGQTINFTWLKKVVNLIQARMQKLSEISNLAEFFFREELKYDPELLIWKKMSLEEVKARLKILKKFLEKLPSKDFLSQILEEKIKKLIQKQNLGVGQTLWPLRVALTGLRGSPGPFEVAEILGQRETLKRIKRAIDLIT